MQKSPPQEHELAELKPDAQPENRPQEGDVGTLGHGLRLGKAVAKAALEHEREAQGQLRDRVKAAENVATNAYAGAFGANARPEEKQKGDEALPPVDESETRAPEVVYSHGEQFHAVSLRVT